MTPEHVHTRRVPTPTIEIDVSQNVLFVCVVGDVDATFADVLVAEVEDALELHSVDRIVVDVERAPVFGAAGLGALTRLSTACTRPGIGLEVLNPSATTLRVLELFGFDHLVKPRAVSRAASGEGLISSGRFDEVVAHGVLNGRDALVLTTSELSAPGPSIVFVNRAFTDLFGYSADEMIGQTPRVLQGPLTDRSTLDQMKSHISRGDAYEGDIVNYRSDGTPFIMSWKVLPVEARSPGHADHYMSLQSDVTADRRRRRFDIASHMIDTLFLTGAFDLSKPAMPIEHAMTTLLAAQTMMLGAGVATVVLTDHHDRDHRYSTATTDNEVHQTDSILATYGREPDREASVVLEGDAHLRIDSSMATSSTYRCARFILSGFHRDWLLLADAEYHERLLSRVFGHHS